MITHLRMETTQSILMNWELTRKERLLKRARFLKKMIKERKSLPLKDCLICCEKSNCFKMCKVCKNISYCNKCYGKSKNNNCPICRKKDAFYYKCWTYK